jgi:GNAT superfamily N-acetyltransferase
MSRSERLISSLDLVERTLSTDVAYTISRMKVLERLPGNPIGIDYRKIDQTAVALMSRLPSFSRVVGLRAGQEDHIEPLVNWYREHDSKPTFEMVPGHFHARLGRELTRLGFFQSGFHVSLIGEPRRLDGTNDDVGIEQVTTPQAMDDYLDAYVAGWGIPDEDQAQFKANVRPWQEQSGWSLYLARINGKPAAAATLFVEGGVAYLADAATTPAMRNQGLQTALLKRRVFDARVAGADVVFSGAVPFSTSHRNMERVGLRVQFVRSLWAVRECQAKHLPETIGRF